jgi:hypothetical protein
MTTVNTRSGSNPAGKSSDDASAAQEQAEDNRSVCFGSYDTTRPISERTFRRYNLWLETATGKKLSPTEIELSFLDFLREEPHTGYSDGSTRIPAQSAALKTTQELLRFRRLHLTLAAKFGWKVIADCLDRQVAIWDYQVLSADIIMLRQLQPAAAAAAGATKRPPSTTTSSLRRWRETLEAAAAAAAPGAAQRASALPPGSAALLQAACRIRTR